MSKAENPFRYFHSSPEVIRLVVMIYVRFSLSLRNVEDLLFERGIDLCHEGIVKLTSKDRTTPNMRKFRLPLRMQ